MEKPSLSHLSNSNDSSFRLVKTIYKSSASPTTIELYENLATGVPVILKKLAKSMIFSGYQTESAKRELEIHSLLHHHNVVELYDAAETSEDYLMLMEFIPQHDYFTEKIEVVRKHIEQQTV